MWTVEPESSCILHMEHHFHPYKLANAQQLQTGDYAQRMNCGREMEALIEHTANLILFMNGEAQFHLNGMVIQRNCRYWPDRKPQKFHERPLYCKLASSDLTSGNGIGNAATVKLDHQLLFS